MSITTASPITRAIDRIDSALRRQSARRHAAIAAGSFVALGVVNTTLDVLYSASNHPVSYAVGQTSFDAESVKSWYAAMTEAGTLDVYIGTQIFDYLFMVALAAFAIAIGSIARRLSGANTRVATIARIGTIAVVAGTIFDAIENLLSFAMLAAPTSFPAWLVMPYSAAAVVKFALIASGATVLMGTLIASVAIAVSRSLSSRAMAIA